MIRDLLMLGAVFASIASAGIVFAAQRSKWWASLYFAIGVFLAWCLLTGFQGWVL